MDSLRVSPMIGEMSLIDLQWAQWYIRWLVGV